MMSYARLNRNLFRSVSVTNIVLWVICSGLVTATTIRYTNLGAGYTSNSIGNLDFILAGLWSSFLYGIGGMFGLCGSYEGRTKHVNVAAVLCGLGFFGAVATAIIAGHVAIYITQNKDDVNNTICHPEVLYPPVFTEEQAKEDCIIWMILEYMLMSYSIAAAVVNAILLIIVLVAVTGPKKQKNLV